MHNNTAKRGMLRVKTKHQLQQCLYDIKSYKSTPESSAEQTTTHRANSQVDGGFLVLGQGSDVDIRGQKRLDAPNMSVRIYHILSVDFSLK